MSPNLAFFRLIWQLKDFTEKPESPDVSAFSPWPLT